MEVTELNQQLKEKIKLKAEELGIDKIGFYTCGAILYFRGSLEETTSGGA